MINADDVVKGQCHLVATTKANPINQNHCHTGQILDLLKAVQDTINMCRYRSCIHKTGKLIDIGTEDKATLLSGKHYQTGRWVGSQFGGYLCQFLHHLASHDINRLSSHINCQPDDTILIISQCKMLIDSHDTVPSGIKQPQPPLKSPDRHRYTG